MAIDPAAITTAQYNLLKTGAAGAAVRAATGPKSAAGVIPAEQLRGALPARPFIVWREGVISGESEEMRGVFGTWWIYDDPAMGYSRIKALIALIEAAYTRDAIRYCATAVTGITQPSEDATLGGLYMRSITIRSERRA